MRIIIIYVVIAQHMNTVLMVLLTLIATGLIVYLSKSLKKITSFTQENVSVSVKLTGEVI